MLILQFGLDYPGQPLREHQFCEGVAVRGPEKYREPLLVCAWHGAIPQDALPFDKLFEPIVRLPAKRLIKGRGHDAPDTHRPRLAALLSTRINADGHDRVPVDHLHRVSGLIAGVDAVGADEGGNEEAEGGNSGSHRDS